MSNAPEVLSALVVGPDDRLVIVLPSGTTLAEYDEFRGLLDRHGWSDGRVLVVVGAEQLAVIQPERAT